ncbi:hypothetical protein [Tropicibacter sp. Alg240-R139]|uniref:hypothetical protein n=1 Tax=Tropicibacter sp. Alg240-R139 TaxID=2305991 RepID=UPI0013DEA4B2|nr:hypothetical protein [Tropicibacter sp. Alg240-R139]
MSRIATVGSITENLLDFKPLIERALVVAEGSHTFDQIVHGVLGGQYHFYPLNSSFIIMEVIVYPMRKSYHCFLAGGNTEELLAAQKGFIADNARALHCDRLSFTGRKGFARRLKDEGWKEKSVHMTFPL